MFRRRRPLFTSSRLRNVQERRDSEDAALINDQTLESNNLAHTETNTAHSTDREPIPSFISCYVESPSESTLTRKETTFLDLPLCDLLPRILRYVAAPDRLARTCRAMNYVMGDCYLRACFVRDRFGMVEGDALMRHGRLIGSCDGKVVGLLVTWGCITNKIGWDTLMRHFVRKGLVSCLSTVMDVVMNADSRTLEMYKTYCDASSRLDLLERAALQNQLGVAMWLVERGIDVHANDERALYFASRVGNLEIVRYLIEKCGCDANSRRGKPLRTAARWEHAELVQYLCTKTTNPAWRSEALKEAASSGSSVCVSILVKEGACADRVIIEASKRGHLEAVSTLWHAEFNSAGSYPSPPPESSFSSSRIQTQEEAVTAYRTQQVVLEDAIVVAATHGHFHIVRFLCGKVGSTQCLWKQLHLLVDSPYYWSIIDYVNAERSGSGTDGGVVVGASMVES
ncbi:hypothetical protein SmJEL517_g06154 [Synchytrium microbalum]|uniref:Uncharacterized protein n=1 Tax=Synchytrium microbalum TaxID=1806994 RepID=A0A507BSY2_9FUNG|nr:uncharacterized protein SmJEL517_g06154 [Synchytrium microbalum]TPX30239.1 hypothetical protein SmJEL517_g06154 [Synchytrium microbalum]